MKFEDQRERMVKSHLEGRGISDSRILEAFRKISRHEFVPPDFRELSYADHPLAIGEGQTISQPYMVAAMVELLEVRPTDKVLEIGTGSGYEAAVLSTLAAEVYTVERIDSLLQRARKILKSMGFANIHYRIGDGSRGWEKAYPPCSSFERIIVSAGAPEVPKALLDQLAEGGRLVIPVGPRVAQELLLITRENGEIVTRNCGSCAFVPLIGEEAW
jgi:protein-L-isoaspartate(D-aspartate) O-methyltransferase